MCGVFLLVWFLWLTDREKSQCEDQPFGCSALSSKIYSIHTSVVSWLHLITRVVMLPSHCSRDERKAFSPLPFTPPTPCHLVSLACLLKCIYRKLLFVMCVHLHTSLVKQMCLSYHWFFVFFEDDNWDSIEAVTFMLVGL